LQLQAGVNVTIIQCTKRRGQFQQETMKRKSTACVAVTRHLLLHVLHRLQPRRGLRQHIPAPYKHSMHKSGIEIRGVIFLRKLES
jgi:hypothetical protein